MELTQKDRDIIRELSRTTYDSWIIPPPMDSLEHILKFRPKNYATIDIDTLTAVVIINLSKFEPLISKLSEKNLHQLDSSIRICFHSNNFMDVEHGGSGMIVPTFMEIIRGYIIWIDHDNCSNLVTKEDKQFYTKYYWCFEQHSLLTHNQMNKVA